MKLLSSLLVVALPFFSVAQKDSLSVRQDSVFSYTPNQIMFGTQLFNSTFYRQINTFQDVKLTRPVNIISIGNHGRINMARGWSYYGHYALEYFVPQDIVVNDQKGKLTGFVISASLYGIQFTKGDTNSNTGIFISVGINAGRMRIIQNELLRQKNPVVAPMIAIDPKIAIGGIVLGLNLQVDYDLSGQNWRRTWFATTNKMNLNGFSQTGFTGMFYIGRIIKYTKVTMAKDDAVPPW